MANERGGVHLARGGEIGRPLELETGRCDKREPVAEPERAGADDETGRAAARLLEGGFDAGRGEEEERDDAGRAGAGRLVAGRLFVSRSVFGRFVVGRATLGALEEAGRDLGRGGTTNAGTSKSSPNGSKGSMGALGRGIKEQSNQGAPACSGAKNLTHILPVTVPRWWGGRLKPQR